MLLADICRELDPAEERLCFIENTGLLSQEIERVLVGWKHLRTGCRIGVGSFMYVRSCS